MSSNSISPCEKIHSLGTTSSLTTTQPTAAGVHHSSNKHSASGNASHTAVPLLCLCRLVDPNRGDVGFSPHRDRQPDDSPATFRPDGSAMYATMWVPLTPATPENSCLYVIPRWEHDESIHSSWGVYITPTMQAVLHVLGSTQLNGSGRAR